MDTNTPIELSSLTLNSGSLLHLLQLASPALPVGAYSYSEGLEALVDAGTIKGRQMLEHWIAQELSYGAIRLEAAVMLRAYQATRTGSLEDWSQWNAWLSAVRETEELRFQSWQMGRALLQLLQAMQPQASDPESLIALIATREQAWNFAAVFGLAAASWQLDCQAVLLGYLHSWATNLVSAGVRLIPLGQTSGQQLLLALHPLLCQATQKILTLGDDELLSCGWGLAIASMTHETQYSRLFRS
ncbi:MAG: urease accessory protein UreF [Leptolyngbyaceae bacterium]|nr:urease accessory protein UreF [Leptolyngbyaceae bacterium]